MTGVLTGPPVAGALPPSEGPRPHRRVVLWACVAIAVVLAVLIAVLATSGKEGQLDAHSPLLGQPAPAISGPNLMAPPTAAGQPTAGLQGAPGHWVLVNFSASWCVPCQQEMPQLLTWAARHRSGNAQIVSIVYQEGDESALTAYFRSRRVTWPLIDDNGAKVSYGVTGIPESYLVDPQGTVVAKIPGGVNADYLDSLIAPYPTAPSGG
jgi:cytochrome c biogenesis protein CcmG/thiol:disulfide interchange protein DsbE